MNIRILVSYKRSEDDLKYEKYHLQKMVNMGVVLFSFCKLESDATNFANEEFISEAIEFFRKFIERNKLVDYSFFAYVV